MTTQQNKKIADFLPLKKYNPVITYQGLEIKETVIGDFYKVSDVEEFLQKITKPENLNKLVKAMMFGKPLDLEDLVK